MRKLFLNRIRAQSTAEYAVLLFLIALAFISMSAYLKRSVQGSLRSNADELGEQWDLDETEGVYTYNEVTESTSNRFIVNIDDEPNLEPGDYEITQTTTDSTVTRTTYEELQLD